MKVATCQVQGESQSPCIGQAKSLGAWWVQCGDTVFLNTEASEWTKVKRKAKKIGLVLKEYPDDVEKKDLHMVVQKGRLFQKEYPNVPILVDKGRYLIVRLTPKEVKKIDAKKEPCFGIQPLKMNTVIFYTRPQPARRIERITWIQYLVNQVTRPVYETTLSHLVSYLSRYSTNSSYGNAAVWCREQLNIMGYATSLENISVDGGSSYNIIADKMGAGLSSRELVLVVAHLDSINAAGGSSASAPGADDNGSGSAGLLKIAAVLKDHRSVHDLRFVLFGGEEQGLDGSTQYVGTLSSSDRSRIRAIVNMDMIGALNTTSPTVLLEGSTVSQAVIDGLSNAASTYTSLTVQTSLYPYASDHVPFINAGLPAVLTIEGADGANSAVHTAGDTIDTINYDLALEILRMNVGYIAAKLEKKGVSIMEQFELSEIKEYLKGIEEYHEVGGILKMWRTSGRYKYNGGTSARATLSARATRTEYPIAALEGPIYKLEDPIYKVEDLFHVKPIDWWKELFKPRFTLHIDIDGTDPLNVVSGTVSRWIFGGTPPHFIGRVTSNTLASGVRNLLVEDFSFQWPGTSDIINKLEIQITGGLFIKHTSAVTFVDSTGNRKFGPYSAEQESIYFRDVEIEVDREDHAQGVEPYNTHTHPDRPADLPEEDLTFEKVFARAGIRITRSSGSDTINTADVPGGTWSYQEIHDAMEDHWAAFSNKPQWKMWIFLAELAEDSGLGGAMFDGNINEPGGVDRQGTAVFTKCAFYHDVTGAYIQDNPPTAEAVKRELFFNYIHESGHTFNLAHSWQKELGNPWTPPSWMPLTNDSQAPSIMNYPELATQSATGSTDYNATWFYEHFRFTFIDDELLFLRHAPDAYVQMGNEDWFENHGRVSRSSLDRRLELVVRSRKKIVDVGEPVFLELRLRNKSDKPVTIPAVMDPADVFTEVAITNPRGERRPFIPFLRTRMQLQLHTLEPGGSLYESINVTMGKFGFPFKEPGPYRIEVSYRTTHGGTAAAVMQLWVRPPTNYDDMPIISELFNARIGRVIQVGGSRLIEDANEKLDWVINNLSKAHPAKYYLSAVKGMPLAKGYKVLRADSNRVRLLASDPESTERLLKPLVENMDGAADSLGHIMLSRIVDTYTKCAVDADKKSWALKAQENMLQLFEKRGVVKSVIESVQRRIQELK